MSEVPREKFVPEALRAEADDDRAIPIGFRQTISPRMTLFLSRPVRAPIDAKAFSSFWNAIGQTSDDYANLTASNFLIQNLLPVTIGNIIGGAGLVGAVYWCIYLLRRPRSELDEHSCPSFPENT